MRIFLSIQPAEKAGGSNTFAYNFALWAKRNNCVLVPSISDAEVAIVIAHRGVTVDGLRQAREKGCFIIHRIDEHLGAIDTPRHREKHQKIRELNAHADITVYQSRFVRETAQPYLQAKHHVVILNGGNPDIFYPSTRIGKEIGHVTWGLDEKKRLDLLHKEILARPHERFRLVGRHMLIVDPLLSFKRKNVTLRGEKKRKSIPGEYRKMKVLFFPSQNDPCPNTVIEALLSGVPVCYHDSGGTPELVKDCGLPLERFDDLLENIPLFRARCLARSDLYFDAVMDKYRSCWSNEYRKNYGP